MKKRRMAMTLCLALGLSLCACGTKKEAADNAVTESDASEEEAPVIRDETYPIKEGSIQVVERQDKDGEKLISILTMVEDDWQIALAQWYFTEISSQEPLKDYKLVTIMTKGSSGVLLANNTPSFTTVGEEIKLIDREVFIDEHRYDEDDETTDALLQELISCMNQHFNGSK